MGKTTNRLLKIANLAVTGQRDEALRELVSLRDYHLRESGMERTVDEHFQELAELVKGLAVQIDRKSTRLNSSHQIISYAVFCLKKKKKKKAYSICEDEQLVL